MKLHKLVQAKGVFAPIVRMKLPPKLSYKIMKFLRAIEFEENFLNSKIQEILNEFGQKDNQGKLIADNNKVKIVQGKEKECQKALTELNDIEVNAPDIFFTLDELKDITLSVQDMAIIEDFIKEDNTNG